MHDKEDFFSPWIVDERLDLSLTQREEDAERDPDLSLISDLRYLYGAEGTENVRSLQRVWERLKDPRTQAGPDVERVSPPLEEGRHLRLLKPLDEEAREEFKQRRKYHQRGKGLAVMAALLFLVVMIGSLFTIVNLTRNAQAGGSARTAVAKASASIPATVLPGYPYPLPGKALAVSPPSPEAISALAWSPDGQRLALSTQSKVWLWDVASNHYQAVLDTQKSVTALAWSPNGRSLAVGSSPLQILDVSTGNVIGTYSADYPILPVPGQPTQVTALDWSPDGNMLAVATQHTSGVCYAFVWNILTGTGINTFIGQGSTRGITSLSWSGDNRYIASSDGQTVQAWDAHNSYVFFTHKLSGATEVAWSPQPGLIAFVNHSQIQVWDVWHGPPQTGLLVSHYPAANGVLSWSPKGQYLATASKNAVSIVEASTGALISTYTSGTHYIHALAWSPDGDAIATGESGTASPYYARIWSA